jgi:hypothetical protein
MEHYVVTIVLFILFHIIYIAHHEVQRITRVLHRNFNGIQVKRKNVSPLISFLPSFLSFDIIDQNTQKMWYQHMLPSMETDLLGSEVMGAALQPLFFMIEESTDEEYSNILLPILKNVMSIPRSVQVTACLC